MNRTLLGTPDPDRPCAFAHIVTCTFPTPDDDLFSMCENCGEVVIISKGAEPDVNMRVHKLVYTLQQDTEWDDTVDLLVEHATLKRLLAERLAVIAEMEALLDTTGKVISERLGM